jgi:protein-S-isoprenylcysteine O-methyltransferase Ste14
VVDAVAVSRPHAVGAIIRVLGVLFILAGVVVLIHAFVRFVTEGFDTPLPAAPPKHLVVGGLYRWVRNTCTSRCSR